MEVIGDPYESLGPGGKIHPRRPLIGWWLSPEQQRLCREAKVVTYVTQAALQRRYPPSPLVPTMACANVQLPPAAFVAEPRAYAPTVRPMTLLTVAILAQPYKGVDVLIAALARCVSAGMDLRLMVVGDGVHRRQLEQQARSAGLGERVQFLGQVAFGAPMRALMDQADLFVLPSRAEGLPRALLEAMARGLPCLGTNAGGMPEVLAAADMVPPDQPAALAGLILQVVGSPARLRQMSARSLETARRYGDDVLGERRLAFYREVVTATARWVESSDSSRGHLSA
jgi:glycosyltransferase involved in cell wall biosynthesis